MKLYLVKGAAPYFVSKQDEAKRDARSLRCEWEAVEVPTTDGREALAAFLNTLGGPASVQIVADEGNDEHVPTLPAAPLPSQQSIDMDDAFGELPLARQLHFAAVAMENARMVL